MQDRRDFLKLGAAGLVGLFANTAIAETTEIDANFGGVKDLSNKSWKRIQKEFTIKNKLNYLNTGTMGPVS